MCKDHFEPEWAGSGWLRRKWNGTTAPSTSAEQSWVMCPFSVSNDQNPRLSFARLAPIIPLSYAWSTPGLWKMSSLSGQIVGMSVTFFERTAVFRNMGGRVAFYDTQRRNSVRLPPKQMFHPCFASAPLSRMAKWFAGHVLPLHRLRSSEVHALHSADISERLLWHIVDAQ